MPREFDPSRRRLIRSFGDGFAIAGTIWLVGSLPSDSPRSEIYKRIDVSTLPDRPPTSVVNQRDTVLAIQSGQYSSFASGVKIADDLALTAKHVFGATPPESISCSALSIEGSHYAANTIKQVISPPMKEGKQQDIALIKTVKAYPFADLPNAILESKPLDLSEPLFFQNYEPTENGQQRRPNNLAVPDALAAPAFYGGLPLVKDANGLIIVATGLKNYNPHIIDPNTRPGASGGPVFDAQGRLRAIEIAVAGPFDTSALEKFYNVTLQGIDKNSPVGLSYIQPIDETLIASLAANLEKLPPVTCM